jgi:hypothetical protein
MNLPLRLVVVASVLTLVGCATRTPVAAPEYHLTHPESDTAVSVHRFGHLSSPVEGAGPAQDLARRRLEALLRDEQLKREDLADAIRQFGQPDIEGAREVGDKGIIVLCALRDDGTIGRCRPTISGARLFR